MQSNLTPGEQSAWEKGDLAYELDDTIEVGIRKAASVGIRPGTRCYAAFLTAFSRRVRSKAVAARHSLALAEAADAGE